MKLIKINDFHILSVLCLGGGEAGKIPGRKVRDPATQTVAGLCPITQFMKDWPLMVGGGGLCLLGGSAG